MHGRFNQWLEIHAIYSLGNRAAPNLRPSWNDAPTQDVGVIVDDGGGLAYKELLVSKLKEGVEAWNAWVATEAGSIPTRYDLSGAMLAGTNLAGVNLRKTNLIEADLTGANLRAANLTEADLFGANLRGANLDWADLSSANLREAKLSGAFLDDARLTGANLMAANLTEAQLCGSVLTDLTDANLAFANLSRANLREAQLCGANLDHADLSGAYLVRANLNGASLFRANFAGARLSGANLTDTDVSETRNLAVDSNRIVHTRFSPAANDKWSILRRTYTGPNMVLNILFVFLFFAPMIVKGAALWSFGEGQTRVVDALNRIEGVSVSAACHRPDGAIIGTFPAGQIHLPCRSESMWRLLLGVGGPYGILMPVLTGILVTYQIARYLLTRRISLMRDAEERSGVSPPKGVWSFYRPSDRKPMEVGWSGYEWLFRVHQVLLVVFLFATAAFALRAYEFLFLTDIIVHVGGL